MTDQIGVALLPAPPPVQVTLDDTTGQPVTFSLTQPAPVRAEFIGTVGPPVAGVVTAEDPLLYDPALRSMSIARATVGGLGVIQLAGDLGGTATEPTVPGLAGKASADALASLSGTVDGLATTVDALSGLPATVDSMAATITAFGLSLTAETDDRIAAVDGLTASIATLSGHVDDDVTTLTAADAALGDRITTEVNDRTAAVAGVQGDVDAINTTIGTLATVDALTLETQARQQAIDSLTSSTTTSLAAKADLIGGVVPTSQLPAIPTFTTHPVASQAAMLALSARVGDVAIRSDQSFARYMLTALPASTLANWLELTSDPTAAVDSVNGHVGPVVLGYADVGADPANAAATAQAAAISTAATDATTKANNAQAAAISAAATDATSKANSAQSNAITAAQAYTDGRIGTVVPQSWLAQPTAGVVTGVATLDAAGLLAAAQRPYATNPPVGLSSAAARGTGAGFAREGHVHPSTVTIASAADVGLLMTGAPSQSGNYVTIQNSALASIFALSSAGALTLAGSITTPGALNASWYVAGSQGAFTSTDPAITPGWFKMAASPTANASEWRNAASVLVASVQTGGGLFSAGQVQGNSAAFTNAMTSRTAGITGTAAADILADLKGAASATGAAIRLRNSALSALFIVDAFGTVQVQGQNAIAWGADNTVAGALGFDGSMLQLGSAGRVQSFAGTTGTFLLNNTYYDGANWRGITTASGQPSTFALFAGGLRLQAASTPASNNAIVTMSNLLNVFSTGAIANTLFSTSAVGLKTTMTASASGDGYELINSAAAVVASITAAGRHKWSSGNVQTTVGAAGAAAALPGAPSKYLQVVGDDGVTYVLAAWKAA